MKKNKNILIVGDGTSQITAIKKIKDLGYYCIAIDGDENAKGLEHASESYVCDITDSKEIIKISRNFNVDAITSFSTDVPIKAISEACSYLNLPSISKKQASLSVNKFLQRKLLRQNKIFTPKFETFDSVTSAMQLVKKFNSPIVIKPVDSSGSRGVRYFDDFSEINANYLIKTLNLSKSNLGIIESFVEGQELAVDGFILGGDFKIISICEKTRTQPPFLLDTELKFPADLNDSSINIIKKFVKKVVKATKILNSPIHMEIINSPKGPVLVEFGARGAGFNVFDTILPFVSGIDTIQLQVSMALGENLNIKKVQNKAAILSFVSTNYDGTLQEIPDCNKILSIPSIKYCQFFVKKGDKVKMLKSGDERLGYILSLSNNLEDCEKSIIKAKELIKIKLKT